MELRTHRRLVRWLGGALALCLLTGCVVSAHQDAYSAHVGHIVDAEKPDAGVTIEASTPGDEVVLVPGHEH